MSSSLGAPGTTRMVIAAGAGHRDRGFDVRPLLNPALRRFWRGRATVQFGLDPESALVVTDLDPAMKYVLDCLDGRHPESAIISRGMTVGIPQDATRALLSMLDEAYLLDDPHLSARLVHGLHTTERERLEPDLTGLSLSGELRTFEKRRQATVAVYGAGRVGSQIAILLAATGIGGLIVEDSRPTRPGDITPAGLRPDDLGHPRDTGVRRVIRGLAPSTTTPEPFIGTKPRRIRPTVAIIAPDDEADRVLANKLVRADIPHLVVRFAETRAVVGPFVVPGRTPCLRCVDLHRVDRDPYWSKLLYEISKGRATPTSACDVVGSTRTAGEAVDDIIAFIAGRTPRSLGATREFLPSFDGFRRRSWSPHPACGCHVDHLGDSMAPGPRGDTGPSDLSEVE